MNMKAVEIKKNTGGKYHLVTTTVAEYDESELRRLYSRLNGDLNECKKQQQKLTDWETEIKEQMRQIQELLKV